MLPFPGQAPYLCSECKKQYNSASSLLNHFAKHIAEKHAYQKNQTDSEDTNTKQSSKFLLYGHNEEKVESILEKVLKQSLSSHLLRTDSSDSNNHDSSCSISEYCTSSSDTNNCLSEQESHIPQSVVEFEKLNTICAAPATNLMLVKFDLQKRLENCILKLASKRDSKMDASTAPVRTKSQNTSWDPSGMILPVMKSRDLTVTVASNTNNSDEEFNPLKFCIVTMEEGDDKLDIETRAPQLSLGKTGSSKGPSNRKQLAPRKILVEGKKKRDVLKEEKSPSKKKYPCLVCCKVFGWSTDLKRHILTHTGERPFGCRQCPATFTRNFLLQKHESKQHRFSSPPGSPSDVEPTIPEQPAGKTVPEQPAGKTVPEQPAGKTVPEQPAGKGAPVSTKEVVFSSERKRKLQRSMSGKFDGNIIEKRLELRQCSPISVGIFSQQALNIS